ncbi:MAG: zinc metalloprotease [Pirellulaceae bacterium]|nr:MAG: zinc metalloprotease [Pirellulaceae bacterium]
MRFQLTGMLCVLVVSGFSGAARGEEPSAEGAGLRSGLELQYVSPQIGPAEDFYLHVNEGWLNTVEIPPDQSNWGSFSVLDDQAKEHVREIIEAAAASNAPPGSDAQKVGDFYRSFTNMELRNRLGIAPARPLLDEVAAVEDAESFARMVARLFRKGIAGPFFGFVSPDARQSDQYGLYLTQSGITLPDRDYYLVDNPVYQQAVKDLTAYIADMMEAFDQSDPQGAATRIVDLEKRLAEIFWAREVNRDPVKTYNKLTRDQLQELLSNFQVAAFLDEAGIGEHPEFIVRQPDYFAGLNALFADVPLSTWKEYFTFQVIDAVATDLSEEIEQRHFAFHQTALSGVEQQKPLWRRGVEACNGILGEVVGRLYVEQHFPPEAKRRMDELVENLKRAFARRIEKLDWMSPVTKQAALEKLSKFTTKIGYPDKWKDYSKLVIKSDDLVGNYLRAAEVEYQRQIERLGGPIDRTEWFMTPQTVNAYYNPTMNEIVFPAAILQPPFFNMEADDAVNYGGIGAVIGHEISHGFDDKGSQYDGDGNLRNWWSPEDRAEFERRARRLVEQYNAYKPFDDMNVNGEFTLGENIGDLGGMAVAYEAYRMSLGDQEPPVIDGLTGDQRFFYGWAQIWRRKYREPELRKRLVQDPHAPSQYRCNGIVSNMDAFYEAFEVKPSDPMYLPPEKRVRIW